MQYTSACDDGDIAMDEEARDVLYKGLKFHYDYDFGTTTSLILKVIDEYPIAADSRIVLLSRNEPLMIMCTECENGIATKVCTVHWNETLLCDPCAKKHSEKCIYFNDNNPRRVVNSPRMGKCVYNGGTIDKERDGVYQI